MKRSFFRAVFVASAVLAAGLMSDFTFNTKFLVHDAEARFGRPVTPVSFAGVARRTTRRVIRRSAVYVATLPRGCQTVIVEGTSLYLCGTTYYQSSGGRYVVVYVN